MSVMECSRSGCDNVMCDRHSDKYGYICWECYNELAQSRGVDIAEFMKTPKSTNLYDYEHWVRDLNMIFEDI